MTDDTRLSAGQRRGELNHDWLKLLYQVTNMERYLLFVGGHEGGGAVLDWSHFNGSFISEHDLREHLTPGSYYTILDGQTAKVIERGHCDMDGGCHPWPESESA